MSRELKKRDHLSTFLRRAHASALDAYNAAQIHSRATSGAAVEQEDDFAQALDPPPILGNLKRGNGIVNYFLFGSELISKSWKWNYLFVST